MDEKKRKALAAELAKGLKTEADLNAFSRMLTKLTVETALNAELTEHLGHEKNAPKRRSVAHTRGGQNWALITLETCSLLHAVLHIHPKRCCATMARSN